MGTRLNNFGGLLNLTDWQRTLLFFLCDVWIVINRQEERKGTAVANFGVQFNRTTEQVGKTAADRKTEACTSIFSAG